jgi:nucleotide-binding universal stress UspA family protein
MVVALDGSPLAEEVLPHAVALAKAPDLKIDLLSVLPGNDPAFGDGSRPSMERDKSLAYLQSTQAWV